MNLDDYREIFLKHMEARLVLKAPETLYKPIQYLLQLGGKRLRPLLTLLSCELFDGEAKDALDAALAIELFHNFSLIHDDIMDSASLRRGQVTVHEKWDQNTAILSGDALMVRSYQCFENYPPALFKELFQLFNSTALQVCEGQQYDMDFENSVEVRIDDYLAMITQKTAVLIAAAMKTGAMIAGAAPTQASLLYDFGLHLGIAFQLQDDYLDTFGDPAVFGKKIGGDIVANKKTFLYLKALECANDKDKEALLAWYQLPKDTDGKVAAVTRIFKAYQIDQLSQEAIQVHTDKAFAKLDGLRISGDKKAALRSFARNLMQRAI